jgi:hypothetical protein
MSMPQSSLPYRKTYEFLLKYFTSEYIQKRYIFWRNLCRDIIEDKGLSDQVIINYDLLVSMVLNYFTDISRLKGFHEIKQVNRIKVYAYSFFWLLRTSPVQILGKTADRAAYINEKIVVSAISALFLRRGQKAVSDEKTLERFEEELLYHFKYRNYTAQSIEIMLASFYMGRGSNPFKEGRLQFRESK